MHEILNELDRIVNEYSVKVSALSDSEMTRKPAPTKWSRKEIIGHLVDSAQNNLRRFISGQYESNPPKIIYQQEFWVAANDYQNQSTESVVLLWKAINNQISTVLRTMPPENYSKQCDTGQLRTLEWLSADYVKHMKHHLNQVFPNSFDIVYP